MLKNEGRDRGFSNNVLFLLLAPSICLIAGLFTSSFITYTLFYQYCNTFLFILFKSLGDVPEPDAVKIGPLWINWRQVKIGFTSALIVVPANLLIIILFKKAGPKVNKNAEKYSEQKSDNSSVSPSTIELDQGKLKDIRPELNSRNPANIYLFKVNIETLENMFLLLTLNIFLTFF